jgi:hypothetical protein
MEAVAIALEASKPHLYPSMVRLHPEEAITVSTETYICENLMILAAC